MCFSFVILCWVFPPHIHTLYEYYLNAWEFKLYCIPWIAIIVNNVGPCVCVHRTNAVDKITTEGDTEWGDANTHIHILNCVFCAKALRTLPWNSPTGSHISMIFTYIFHHRTFPSSYYPIFVHLNEWIDTLSHCVQFRLFLSHPRTYTHHLEHAPYAYRLAFNERNTTENSNSELKITLFSSFIPEYTQCYGHVCVFLDLFAVLPTWNNKIAHQ